MGEGPGTDGAVVTGAGHGIGRACALELAREGYDVVAVDIDEDALDALPPVIRHRIVHDVSESPADLARSVLRLAPCCPTIVNNVGITAGRSFLDLDPDGLETTWRTNVAGPWELTRQLVHDLIGRSVGGSVVFVGSLHSERVRMFPDYSATKAAIAMLVRELASELGPHRIRVNAVSPGIVDTWSDRMANGEGVSVQYERIVPLRRIGTPEDVARVVAFLCSPNAAYVTGSDIRVDGALDSFNWLHVIHGSAAGERAYVDGSGADL
jgi:NAD(P)-dependent dehydrogenase (short-subunit alcohol dehydrogenase family)